MAVVLFVATMAMAIAKAVVLVVAAVAKAHAVVVILRSAWLYSLCLLTLFTGLLTHFPHFLVGQRKFVYICSR